MESRFRNGRFAFGCILLTLALPPQAAESTELYIEEVIVTAQKREQSIQDVPIAVSAFDSQFLDDAGVDDVMELQIFAPGLTIFHNQTVAQTNFRIRGVGTAGNSLSLESSVGIYVDGVYRSRQSSAINDLIDIQRVEVLKGPQGTLFGKNTASGAVQFLTVPPQLDEFGGYIEANGGNLSHMNLNGAINIPLAEGKAAMRLTAGWTDRDGFVDNETTGSELNDRDRYSLRGQLLFTPTDAVTVRFIADYAEINEKCCAASNFFDGPGDSIAGFLAAGGVTGLVPPPTASYRLSIEHLGGQVGLADDFDEDEVFMDLDPFADIEESGFSLEINWEIGNATLTSLTSYRSYDADGATDTDFTSLDSLVSEGFTEQDTFTQELRLTGGNDRLNYVVGAYYFDQDLDNLTTLRFGATGNTIVLGGATLGILDAGGFFAPFGIPAGAICAGFVDPALVPLCPLPAFPPGEGSDNISSQQQESWAVFAQTDINLTDNLQITLGLRYLDESKDMDVTFIETVPTPVYALFTPLSPFVPDVDGATFDDDEFTGTAKLSYFWNDNVMTYVSFGRGYKSGGTNVDRISPATGAPLLFDPETSDSYEIGLKGDFLDRRLRINLAVYHTDFDDFQENTFVGTGFVLQNAGKIKSTGGELEIFALPTPWLSLSAGLSYVDADYDEFLAGACTRTPLIGTPDAGAPNYPNTCDNTGNRVPLTPEFSFYASAHVSQTFGNGMVGYGQLDVSYRDDTEAGNDNDPNKVIPSYTLVNLRLGVAINDRYDVSVWAKNLFDDDYHGGSFNSVIREGTLTAYITEPRTWGATLRATF